MMWRLGDELGLYYFTTLVAAAAGYCAAVGQAPFPFSFYLVYRAPLAKPTTQASLKGKLLLTLHPLVYCLL